MWMGRQRKIVSEEGDENSEQFDNIDIVRGGCGVLVLNRGEEGQEGVSEWCGKGRGGSKEGRGE